MLRLSIISFLIPLLLPSTSTCASSCPTAVQNILSYAPKGQAAIPVPAISNPWDMPVSALAIEKSKQQPAKKYSKGAFASDASTTLERSGVDYEPMVVDVTAPGDMWCVMTPETGSELFLKSIKIGTILGRNIFYVGGLAPDGANMTLSCTLTNGAVPPTTTSIVRKITTVFGSQIINPSTSNLTLKLMARPAWCEIGKIGNFYLAVQFQGQFYFYSNSTRIWKSWHSGEPMPIWFTSTIQAFDTQTAFANINVSALPGIQVFMGYGLSENDMVKYGTVKIVYPK